MGSEVDICSFGLLSVFGVPGPFTFRLHKKKKSVLKTSCQKIGDKSAESDSNLTSKIHLLCDCL